MSSSNPTGPQWRFILDGRTYGPVNTDKIRELCCGGVIQNNTKVSSTLFEGWVQADSVGALRNMIQTTPRAGSADQALRGVPSEFCVNPAALNNSHSFSVVLTRLLVVASFLIALRCVGAVGALCMIGVVLGFVTLKCGSRTAKFSTAALACAALLSAGLLFYSGSDFGQRKSGIAERDQAAKRLFEDDVKVVKAQMQADLEKQAEPLAEAEPTTAPAVEKTVLKPVSPVAPFEPEATEGERLSALSRQILRDMLQIRTRYQTHVGALHLEQALMPERLVNAQWRADGRQRCGVARGCLAEYDSSIKGLIADIPNRVKKIGVSDATSRSFIAGFDSNQSGRKSVQQLISLESAALDEMESIFYLVDANPGFFKVQNGQIVFARQEDLNAFRQSAQRLTMISRQEQKLQQEAINHLSSVAGD